VVERGKKKEIFRPVAGQRCLDSAINQGCISAAVTYNNVFVICSVFRMPVSARVSPVSPSLTQRGTQVTKICYPRDLQTLLPSFNRRIYVGAN